MKPGNRSRWLYRLSFLAVLLSSLSYIASAQTSPGDAAIRALIAKQTEGWERLDPAKVASTFTSDAIWQNPFGVRLHGKQQIQTFLMDLMSRPGYKAGRDISPITILDVRLTSPTTAAVWTDERIEGLINDYSGNPMQPRHSYYLQVLVKEDGIWKISDALVMDLIHLK